MTKNSYLKELALLETVLGNNYVHLYADIYLHGKKVFRIEPEMAMRFHLVPASYLN